jgi:hypothetical protein
MLLADCKSREKILINMSIFEMDNNDLNGNKLAFVYVCSLRNVLVLVMTVCHF